MELRGACGGSEGWALLVRRGGELEDEERERDHQRHEQLRERARRNEAHQRDEEELLARLEQLSHECGWCGCGGGRGVQAMR